MRDKKRAQELIAELKTLTLTDQSRQLVAKLEGYVKKCYEGDLEGEEWQNIDDCPCYQVSNLGRIRSSVVNGIWRLRKQGMLGDYAHITLHLPGKIKKGALVHRLVAQAFVPNPDGKEQVNHINGCKTDNRACNLEWVTASENTTHAYRMGLIYDCNGVRNSHAKMTAEQVKWLRDNCILNDPNLGVSAIAKQWGIKEGTVRAAFKRRNYKHVE